MNRQVMLMEMGIRPLWRLRDVADAQAPDSASTAGEALQLDSSPDAAPDSRPAAMTFSPDAVRPEVALMPESASPVPAAKKSMGDAAALAELGWDELEAAIRACRTCPLANGRQQAVPGTGDRQADWLFIGEGPGAEEDARGEPFVGQAGKLLDNMLAALGLRRDHAVYIANAVKCRPPGNRTPAAEEMAACRPFLLRQIALIQPRIIVLLGRAAAHSVLGEDSPLASMRGKDFDLAGVPVVVTYHPAYLLRNLPEKAKAWEDLLFARRRLRQAPATTD